MGTCLKHKKCKMAVGEMRQDRTSRKRTNRRETGSIGGQTMQDQAANQAANAYMAGETGVPIAEAARVLGVNIRAIRWMCAGGKLRCFFTTGGDWQVVTADLEAARQGSAAAAPANRPPSEPSPILPQEKERVEELALQEPADEERQRAEGEEAAQRAREQEAKGMGLEVIAHTEQGRQEQKRPEDEPMAAQARRKWEDEVLDEARKQLPYSAQGTYSLAGDFEDRPSEWDIRARQAAADAIRQLGNDAPFSEIRALAMQAGKRVAQEYKHHQACERVVAEVWLRHGTASDDQAAREAVRQALKKLPVGCSQAEMEEVRDAALARSVRSRQFRRADRP